MCGIAGIIGQLSDFNRGAIRRMNDALAHRGPDGFGYWESPANARHWGVMLAHRRLSILDLSTSASQPMIDPVTGDVVVLNGEIYNYVEIRDQLIAEGHSFQSTGDTAVMLRLVSKHGRSAVSRLRGMFAFGMWDSDAGKLLLARDPLGIKPLYFARNPDPDGDWALIFASEVRGILATGLLGKAKLNPRAAASIVWNGFVMAPETAIAGIEAVWPGELRVFDSEGEQEVSKQYWRIPRGHDVQHTSQHELAHEVRESVRVHLASDVPLAVFLSGGVDSAAVANLAQKAAGRPVHTFTLAFAEQEFNEGIVAGQLAKAIGTEHQEYVLTERHFIEHLDAAIDSLDQPSFDGLNSYYISHAVRDAGFKVALVGTGGDELFGGYKSFRDLPKLGRISQYTNWMPESAVQRLAGLMSSILQPSHGAVPQQTRWAKLQDMVSAGDDVLRLYQLAYSLFLPDFQHKLLAGNLAELLSDGLPSQMHSRLRREIADRSFLSAISVLEQRLFLGERLLRDTDATSMAASIEVRLPLVDSKLLERTNGLTDRDRYYPVGKKSVLREIGLEGLDPALFDRSKSGFVLPYDRWLRSGLGDVLNETMRDRAAIEGTGLDPDAVWKLWRAFLDGAPGLYWSRIWAVYVFIRWCRRHQIYL